MKYFALLHLYEDGDIRIAKTWGPKGMTMEEARNAILPSGAELWDELYPEAAKAAWKWCEDTEATANDKATELVSLTTILEQCKQKLLETGAVDPAIYFTKEGTVVASPLTGPKYRAYRAASVLAAHFDADSVITVTDGYWIKADTYKRSGVELLLVSEVKPDGSVGAEVNAAYKRSFYPNGKPLITFVESPITEDCYTTQHLITPWAGRKAKKKAKRNKAATA